MEPNEDNTLKRARDWYVQFWSKIILLQGAFFFLLVFDLSFMKSALDPMIVVAVISINLGVLHPQFIRKSLSVLFVTPITILIYALIFTLSQIEISNYGWLTYVLSFYGIVVLTFTYSFVFYLIKSSPMTERDFKKQDIVVMLLVFFAIIFRVLLIDPKTDARVLNILSILIGAVAFAIQIAKLQYQLSIMKNSD